MNYIFRSFVAVAGVCALNFGVAQQDANALAAPVKFLRADYNQDGQVNITDVVAQLAWMFREGDAPGCNKSADVNDDGEIDISDVIASLLFQFSGRIISAPAPGPNAKCGTDPTEDSLTCASFKAEACPVVPPTIVAVEDHLGENLEYALGMPAIESYSKVTLDVTGRRATPVTSFVAIEPGILEGVEIVGIFRNDATGFQATESEIEGLDWFVRVWKGAGSFVSSPRVPFFERRFTNPTNPDYLTPVSSVSLHDDWLNQDVPFNQYHLAFNLADSAFALNPGETYYIAIQSGSISYIFMAGLSTTEGFPDSSDQYEEDINGPYGPVPLEEALQTPSAQLATRIWCRLQE